MKANRRGRRAKPIDIPALEPLDDTPRIWERQRISAALARIAAKSEPTAQEVPDVIAD